MVIPPQLLAGIAKYGPMALSFIGAQKGAKRGEERAAADEAAALKGNLGPQYGVSDSWNKFLSMSRQDPAADMLRQQQAASEAANIGAMKAGGAKAIIGAGSGLAQQAARQRQRIEADSFTRQQDALKAYAGQEQSVDRMNTQRAQGQFDIAREQKRGFQDARQQNWFDLGSTLLGQVGSGDFKGVFNKDNWTNAENGARIKETPGAFSHKTNPIDIVRKGRKIGEMTGGEAILNPEQTRNIEAMSQGGNTELHRYVRSLLRKFDQER